MRASWHLRTLALRRQPAAGEPGRVWFAHAARGLAVALVVWFHLGETFLLQATVVERLALLPPQGGAPRPWYLVLVTLTIRRHILALPGHECPRFAADERGSQYSWRAARGCARARPCSTWAAARAARRAPSPGDSAAP